MCSKAYKDLTHTLKALVREEVKQRTDLFTSAHTPTYATIEQIRCRFSILARPTLTLGNGKHDLQVGRNEVLLFTYGSTLGEGQPLFIPAKPHTFRLVCGPYYTASCLCDNLHDALQEQGHLWRRSLQFQDYDQFVKEVVGTLTGCLEVYKGNLMHDNK